jgi:cytochrome P450 / NADPH-cytochrome P450 reductase
MADATVRIPEPPGLPLLGNIADIDSEFPLGSYMHLADIYGKLMSLAYPTYSVMIVSERAVLSRG